MKLVKTKSFWTGISAVVIGAGGFFTGAMSPVEAIQTVLGGFAVIFIRDGIGKVEKQE